ncbi:MAG: UDP-N-acetylglucosamine 2-epimerase (non-hydrolyzing), partial [bacterium]|nr:UDP-N-acetylglucosamine 2-epimerase (non-hydrolyzing) [bacterium]
MRRKITDKIAIIAGARPNFVKIFPLAISLRKNRIPYFIVNTGQHFSKEMSADLLKEFSLAPNYSLKPNTKTSLRQFSDILVGLEKIFIRENPSLVIVVGDVNSTLAGAIAAKKLNLKLAHIEAGLRSHNRKMPEEYNRVITDRLADILFVSSESDIKNLKKENISKGIYFVGNIMMDTLAFFRKKIKTTKRPEEFYLCTIHRSENVDNEKVFTEMIDALEIISKDCKIYLPLHPRTRKMAVRLGLYKRLNKIFSLLPVLSYEESLYFQKNAKLILTDSGGIQEEASFLGTPCLTLRTETERPVTIKFGTNTLAGVTKKSILRAYSKKKLRG